MRDRAAATVVPGLVVLALVAVVAVAATGSTRLGTNEARPPGSTLLDTIVSLGMLGVVLGGVMLLYGLTQRKAVAREMTRARKYRRWSYVTYVLLFGLFLLAYYRRARNWRSTPTDEGGGDLLPVGTPPPATPPGSAPETAYEPRFAWVPVAIVVGLALAGIAAYLVAERRRARARRTEDTLAAELAGALEDSLDDLRAEREPRRAVIAAYARLERVVAAHGLPRRPTETPSEFLARILAGLEVTPDAVARLTELFSLAKFSQHAVDIAMKEEAIGALEEVRDELRAARTARAEAAPILEAGQPA